MHISVFTPVILPWAWKRAWTSLVEDEACEQSLVTPVIPVTQPKDKEQLTGTWRYEQVWLRSAESPT